MGFICLFTDFSVAYFHAHKRAKKRPKSSRNQQPVIVGVIDNSHAGQKITAHTPKAGAQCMVVGHVFEIMGVNQVQHKHSDKGKDIVPHN